MSSLPPADASLYELAMNSPQPPQSLQLSPTTFKSMVGLFLNFLVEHKLPATIWMKLPRGEAWQAEIDRFSQSMTAPYSIYSLQTYQKPDPKPPSASASELSFPESKAVGQPAAAILSASAWLGSKMPRVDGGDSQEISLDDLMLDEGGDVPGALAENGAIRTVPLATNSQLKREYFVLIISPSFYGLVIAHRPRSLRAIADGMKLSQAAEEALDRKHTLLGVFTFDPMVLQRVLEEGINPAICLGQPSEASNVDLADVLLSWEDLKQQNRLSDLDPVLMGKLLTQQVQQQEDLWRNTTQQRRQVEALPMLRQENAELLDALQVKDEFIKTMGLELRTPLSTMKTALSLLNSTSLKQPQRQRYMEMLSHECDRQSSLITSVLDLVQLESTVEQTPMEPLRLSDILPGVVSTYQPLAQEKGIMLGYVVSEDLPPVACITPWLKQIVINLLHNSIKFTPKGGQVWVRTKQVGDSIQIEFRDSGIGIAANDLPRIFDRFYRSRGSAIEDASGVGLGLSIVQKLLIRCGGSISVKSKQGEGSVFTVILPIYAFD